MLRHVEGLTDKPILIGTWSDASWAIEFYRRNGFTLVPTIEKDRLLQKYWSIQRDRWKRRGDPSYFIID